MRLVQVVRRRTDGNRRTARPVHLMARAAAVLTGLVLVAGCHVPFVSSTGAAPPAGGAVITVGAIPGVADAPLYIAEQHQMFQNAGVNVHIVSYSSVKAELADLQAGKIDVAFGDYADMFYQQAAALAAPHKGEPRLDMVIVADGYDAAPNVMQVLALPNSHITAPKDLQNKTIGTPPADDMPPYTAPAQNAVITPYNLETVATLSVLGNDNVDASKITWRPMPENSLISALKYRRVDAILATEPTIFTAESQLGAVPVLDSLTGNTANLPLDGYFSLRSFAKRQPAQLAAFRTALVQAQAMAAMSSSVRSILHGSVRMSVQDASLVSLGQYPTSMNASDMQRIVKLMYALNVAMTANGNLLDVQSMMLR